LVVLVPLALGGAFTACSSSNGTHNDSPDDDGGSEGSTSTKRTDSGSKPPPKAKDAGTADTAPPPPPKGKADGGVRDAGKLTDARVDATPPDSGNTTTATPLDPIDESIMPDDGLEVGTCTSVGLSKDTGFCRNDSAGQDFVEGCVDPTVYLLDCARYESPGTRSVCQDDGTTVGCYLHDVSPVGDFEKSDTGDAFDLFHACPSSWEGTGFCDGDYLYMCSGGNDYVLDCGLFNTDTFTYTCGKDTISGKIQCQ
jgi:hypothetical protein